MTPERWQRAREVFERALETPGEDRAALLQTACAGDGELRAEVESLLMHHERLDNGFLAPHGVKLRLAPAGPEPWAEALIGRKVGRYLVTRRIGQGGMGSVFEARQEQPARRVALKVLRPGLSTPSALSRFRLEPEVMGRLQHPNIAQVFEAGVHEDERGAVPYFAMEFIPDAQPLIAFAASHELTTRQRLESFAKVCDAVHHGHQKGIIHRDIKPANILVGTDGQPKVIDFGVARATDADIVLTTQNTHTGDLIGTVHYMSPEQCDGDPATIDTRSDIYSLGVVLYELLTGAAPYDTTGTTVYGAIRIIKDEPPRRPSQVNRRLRGDLEAILLKALEKTPARRYASAGDLARDIRRHLTGEPIEARPPNGWQRLLGWAGRRPRTAALLATLLACAFIVAGTIVGARLYWWYSVQEPHSIAYDDESARRRAMLLNRLGTTIREWDAGAGGALVARLIRPYADDERRGLVLVGYNTACLPDRACQVHVHDLRGARDGPVWAWRMSAHDLPPAWQRQGYTADEFSPDDVWTFDVFAEGSRRIDEIVCRFNHNTSSLRELCVFRATSGELLYRACHDGSFDCYWLSAPKLLLLAGENWEVPPRERGCPHETPGAHMLVVFALRPVPGGGVNEPRLLDTSPPFSDGERVWYKWLSVCPIPGIRWGCRWVRPPDGDASAVAVLALDFQTSPPCSMSWRIDADGNQMPGTLVASTYRMVQTTHRELPPPEDFKLLDYPPGEQHR